MNRYQVVQRRGERVLQARDPRWFLKIDPDLLDLQTRGWCVLGQWVGGYENGGYERGRSRLAMDERASAEHGFNLRDGRGTDWEWARLNRVWRRRIRQLRDEFIKNGDVGEPLRRVTVEPLEEPVQPAIEPVTPERETVPAGRGLWDQIISRQR